MNTGVFAGHLGKDAVLAATPSGSRVLNFSVGVAVGYGDQKHTLWVSCALWGERAEKLASYLIKGKAVTVSGDVDLKTYQTRDGRSGAELLLNVQRVTLQGGKEQSGERKQSSPQASAVSAAPADFDDDIPF